MDYIEIGTVAQEAALATSLPIKVSLVYLNCTRWEIRFKNVKSEGKHLSAVVNMYNSDNRDLAHSEIKRQLLAKADN